MEISDIQKSLTLDEKIRLFNGEGSWKTYSADGKIPFIFMSDGPHGLRKQDFENYADLNKSNVATCFPTASCIASSWDVEAAQKLGEAIAAEAKAENVGLMLGPGMNIKRSPLCGRNFEYFSEDPLLTSRLACSYVKGMQTQGVGSCIKHFACNNQETRRQTASSNVDEKTLRKIYLRPFEYVIKNANPAAVMCSYNRLNGEYTAKHPFLIDKVLRKEWNYKGALISDWGACIGAPECLKAGMDLAMPDSYGYFDMQLKEAFQDGKISEKDLDNSNKRILELVKKYGSNTTEIKKVDYSVQHKIALDLAQKSAVLLKNNGILPLQVSDVSSGKKSVPDYFIIGEMAEIMKFQGGGSSHITTNNYPTALELFESSNFNVSYEKGYYSGFCSERKKNKINKPLINRAIKNLKVNIEKNPNLKILFFCGLTEAYEGEGFDRKSLSLPDEQLQLLKLILELTHNVIIINFSGSPVDLSPVKECSAILQMYLCGEACGEAVFNLLTGISCPSGKLAETWPLKIEDTPCYKNFALNGDEINYEEGELVGYRWYRTKNIPVLYEFGYGLSYTDFNFSYDETTLLEAEINKNILNLKTPLEKVYVTVSNTGKFDGAEVIQVYFKNELVGFSKVYLKKDEKKSLIIENEYYKLPELTEGEDFIKPVKIPSRGNYTLTSSLGDMSKDSLRIRLLLKIVKFILPLTAKKSPEDPSIKIDIAAVEENPVESLISTSGGLITYKFAIKLVRWANK